MYACFDGYHHLRCSFRQQNRGGVGSIEMTLAWSRNDILKWIIINILIIIFIIIFIRTIIFIMLFCWYYHLDICNFIHVYMYICLFFFLFFHVSKAKEQHRYAVALFWRFVCYIIYYGWDLICDHFISCGWSVSLTVVIFLY